MSKNRTHHSVDEIRSMRNSFHETPLMKHKSWFGFFKRLVVIRSPPSIDYLSFELLMDKTRSSSYLSLPRIKLGHNRPSSIYSFTSTIDRSQSKSIQKLESLMDFIRKEINFWSL